MTRIHTLETEILLPRPIDEVFAFFADPGNLERLTPPWLRFSIVSPLPIAMQVGARIRYRLRVRGVPISWESLISVWEPPRRFVDEQTQGPYRQWIHEHTFQSVENGTLAGDRVLYAAPGGELVHRLIVRPDLERIFRYREQVLRQIFADAKEGT